ncbi:hypothetical protein WJX77_002860 [Trebouxia sp. C0004]
MQCSSQSFVGSGSYSTTIRSDTRATSSFVKAGARHLELYADEVVEEPNKNILRSIFWEGDTQGDAFLTAAAAQVGQVILTLPNAVATTGMASGVFFQLTFATLALWTLFLLATLYQELKKRKAAWRRDLHHGIVMVTLDELHMSGWTDKVYCVQYHEVVFELCGPWLGSASWLVNVLALVGLAVAQVIACANNMYRLNSFRNKRDYALLFGSVGLTTSFIPSFRNMRIFSFVAILGTSFTAWYMVAHASAQGLQEGLWGQAPTQGLQAFVEGSTNLLFVYGGHAMLMEVMDSMQQPSKFPRVFAASYLYVFTLTLPSAATMFAAFPVLSAQNGNVYDLLPDSPARSVSIVLMIMHQCIAFGMFIMPVHHMWEKLIRTHDKPYWIRLPSRLPVGILVILISLAFPFFGVINSFLGAGTTTLETYIIPALAYNWVYRRESAQIACPTPPPWHRWHYGWGLTLWFNYAIIICSLIFGMGFGMWASCKSLMANLGKFGLFAACYNCSS